MLTWHRGNPRKLWKSYLLAISVLAVSLVGGHLLHVHELSEGLNDARTIDISGRQRMMSQRLVSHVHHLDNMALSALYSGALEHDVGTFEKSHEQLLALSVDFPTAAEVYDVGERDGLDTHVRTFIANIRSAQNLPYDAPELQALQNDLKIDAFAPLLHHLDQAVKAFAKDSSMRHERLAQIQASFLCFSLFILLVECVFIFWPAQATVIRALETADGKAREAENRNIELQAVSECLQHSADHDDLTGLANRKKLLRELRQHLQSCAGQDRPVCVMHVDLDRFKEINDALGHPVGDKVLCRVADVMRSKVGPADLVARVGGDEFVILCETPTDEDQVVFVQRTAEALIANVRAPMLIDGHTCTVGASVGYTFADAQNAGADRLIGDADMALYEAKRAGKGIAVHFQQSMRNGIETRHELIQDIERAIDTNEFVPFLQPKVSLSDGRVVGFEVLTRWMHPTRGMLLPFDFISIAEETGLIDTIDHQAAMGGLEALSLIRKSGWHEPRIAVNASGSSLRNPDYALDLEMAVAMRGLQPHDVHVEVVETTLISDVGDQAISTLTDLAAKGFMVDIDDFGTGYASLAMLSKLNLTGLKIDRGLTMNLVEPRGRQIIEAVIGLAQALKLEVVAEGIENATQFETLREMGCDVAQGYAIGRPMSVQDTLEWLSAYERNPCIASA